MVKEILIVGIILIVDAINNIGKEPPKPLSSDESRKAYITAISVSLGFVALFLIIAAGPYNC